MGLVFCDLVESGIVKAIVSTGALMAHGLVEATGRSHFRYDAKMDDNELFLAGYNRVYDSLEPEVNLDAVEEVVDHVLHRWPEDEVVCSWKLNQRIGEYLLRHAKGRGILKSCVEHNVPVFVPAFTDSELGIDFALYQRQRKAEGKPLLRFDPFLDFEHYATDDAGHKTHGHPHDRWRRAAQLGAAIWRVRGTVGAPRVRENSSEALQLRLAHLSRAGELGRTFRQHLHRSGIVGKICPARRRRPFR